jgi:hypothetical protein
VTVNLSEDLSLEKKQEVDVKSSPDAPAFPMDDFPDGGLAAWSIIFGVSEHLLGFQTSD